MDESAPRPSPARRGLAVDRTGTAAGSMDGLVPSMKRSIVATPKTATYRPYRARRLTGAVAPLGLSLPIPDASGPARRSRAPRRSAEARTTRVDHNVPAASSHVPTWYEFGPRLGPRTFGVSHDIHPPTCQPYLSCDHIFSSGETDRRSRVIIMKQRFSRTHRRPVARGKVNELGRASTQARRASVPPPPSSALDQRFHRAISARFPRDHADASRRAYADASWRGHVPGSTDVPSVPARRE